MSLSPIQAVSVTKILPAHLDLFIEPGVPEAAIVNDAMLESLKRLQKQGITMSALIASGIFMVRNDLFAHDHEGFADVKPLSRPSDERPGDRDEVVIRLEGEALLERSKILARHALNDGRLLLDTDRLHELAAQARLGGVAR